jgi:outer membrane protein assembly factor BamD (BamD/ComL family)
MKRILIMTIMSIIALTVMMQCSRLPDEGLIEKGKRLEDEEKFSEAIKSYEKLVKLYPKSEYAPEALYRVGIVYTNQLQDFNSAISSYRRVIADYPETKLAAQCQFMIGFVYANNAADTTKARIAYTTFIQKYPDHELTPSVKWELKYLGKDINEIPELKVLDSDSKSEADEEK